MFDFSVVTTWFDNLLRQTLGLSGWLATSIECVLVAVGILLSYAVFAIILIYMERKVCAWIQCRLGPNRVGKWGLLQVFADVFKMLRTKAYSGACGKCKFNDRCGGCRARAAYYHEGDYMQEDSYCAYGRGLK